MPGQGKVMLGEPDGGEGGGHAPVSPDPEASLYLPLPGVNSAPSPPPRGEPNLGKIIFYLINYLRGNLKKTHTEKRSSFFKC